MIEPVYLVYGAIAVIDFTLAAAILIGGFWE